MLKMLKIVEDLEESEESEEKEPSTLTLDDNLLKGISKGKKLQLRTIDGKSQFFVEIMNNKKPKKNEAIHVPFRRSVYARGYQSFLTHENGKAKLIFDNNNWITFDIVSFAL
jgi:hypothetical protein